jgi:hypothetical protein
MSSKTAIILLAAVFAPLLTLQTAAQDEHQDSSPLNVTTQFSSVSRTDCKAGDGLVIQLHLTAPTSSRISRQVDLR